MRLDELLDKIDHESEIALQIKQRDGEVSNTKIREVWKLLGDYGGDENFFVSEIEPDGYIDMMGISYLRVLAYDQRDVQQDELPFPLEEKIFGQTFDANC